MLEYTIYVFLVKCVKCEQGIDNNTKDITLCVQMRETYFTNPQNEMKYARLITIVWTEAVFDTNFSFNLKNKHASGCSDSGLVWLDVVVVGAVAVVIIIVVI